MKKLLKTAIALCLLAACLVAMPLMTSAAGKAVVSSGTVGDNLSWVIYDDCSLVISGTGSMADNCFYTEAPWFKLASAIKSVVIEKGVTDIADYAFADCTKVETVTIADSVTKIGESAFAGCEKLKTVQIPNSVTEIAPYAFYCCSSLKNLTLGTGLTQLREWVFYGCTALETVNIPAGVTTIGEYAFADCTGLKTVTLPDTLTSLKNDVFAGCANLPAVVLPAGLTELGDSVFFNCTALESVNIPAGVTKLGAWTFYRCSSLKTIQIPAGVNTLGDFLFQECSSLESISIPAGVKVIGDQSFLDCVNLKSVDLPDGLLAVGRNAFWGCASLESITLPDSVATVGSAAFTECTALKEVTIPDKVKSIEDHLFAECTALESVTLPAEAEYMGTYVFYKCENLKSATLPEGIPTIGNYAFYKCSALTQVEIPETVTEIGEYAFWGCSVLDALTVPESVKTINTAAFSRSGLTRILFQGDAPEITAYAFGSVTATAYYPADNATWTEEKRQNYGGTITWVPLGDEEHTVTWVSASTTLGGNIGLNFYVKLSDSLVAEESTFMRFTFAGDTIDVPFSQAIKSTGSAGLPQYRFTCPISAKSMTDLVTAQVMTSEGTVGDSKSLAVVTYCNFMIQNSTDEKLTGLMKAMLNYGAAAQVLFNHNTDNLANGALSEADKVLEDVDASRFAASVSGAEEGIALSSATLLLETETTARVYFKLTGTKTIDQFTFLVDGKEVTPQQKGGEYYVEIPDIAAQDLDRMHTVTVGGITVQYAGLSYVATVLKNPDIAGEDLVNTAKALYAYNKLAESYFN